MKINDKVSSAMRELFRKAAAGPLQENDYKEICEAVGVARLYYDMDLGESGRYRNQKTLERVVSGKEIDNVIVLYDSGAKRCVVCSVAIASEQGAPYRPLYLVCDFRRYVRYFLPERVLNAA